MAVLRVHLLFAVSQGCAYLARCYLFLWMQPLVWLSLNFCLQVMHDAFGVRLHAGKQAEVCHHHPKMSYMALCLNRAPTFSAKFLFYFSYIDKFSAIGIKICIFSWMISAIFMRNLINKSLKSILIWDVLLSKHFTFMHAKLNENCTFEILHWHPNVISMK